jgi:hypothetical protein
VLRTGLFGALLFMVMYLSISCGRMDEASLEWLNRPIVNGEPDSNPDHDAVVAIFSSGGMCSGTLVSPDVVLTAGHCLYGVSTSNIYVMFGDDVHSGNWLTVSEKKVHPSYSSDSSSYDIAMLRLAEAPPDGVQPIPPLPHSIGIGQADIGQPLEYVGFGVTENGGGGEKLTVSSDLNWVCTNSGGCVVGLGIPAMENTICSDQIPGGPCSGDSGGPAFVIRNGREYVAGITSYGDEDCTIYGCSTKVDEYEEFLDEYLDGFSGDSCTLPSECLSGFCVNGVCCSSACTDACSSCVVEGFEGTCRTAPNGTSCSDGNVCNGEDVCLLGKCMSGDILDCDDEDICSQDSCDPVDGCQNVPVEDGTPCLDNDMCNGEETCQAGECQTGTTLDCNDQNPCTEDQCDQAKGCKYTPLESGTVCGDCRVCDQARCVPSQTEECVQQSCGCGMGVNLGNDIFWMLLVLYLVARRKSCWFD